MEVIFKNVYKYKTKFDFNPLFMMEKLTSVFKKRADIKRVEYNLNHINLEVVLYKKGEEEKGEEEKAYTGDEYLELQESMKKIDGFSINNVNMSILYWGTPTMIISLERK